MSRYLSLHIEKYQDASIYICICTYISVYAFLFIYLHICVYLSVSVYMYMCMSILIYRCLVSFDIFVHISTYTSRAKRHPTSSWRHRSHIPWQWIRVQDVFATFWSHIRSRQGATGCCLSTIAIYAELPFE